MILWIYHILILEEESMKKCIKYIVSGIVFFIIMTLLDYIFKLDVDFKVNAIATIIYINLNILCDFIFKDKEN